jgi:cell division protease FtsH
MDIKRIFRGPWLWIVVAVVGVLVALQYLAPNGGYEEIDTSEMATKIESGEVKEILFVDLDQEIRAELDDGTKVIASWVGGTQRDLIQSAAQGVEAG